MKYRDMTPERREAKKARQRKRYAEQREAKIAYQRKYHAEHREERKKYRDLHREERKKYRDLHREERKKWEAQDLNKNGITKNWIRVRSNCILRKVHVKLPGYEIHHCFGYEDPSKFIYIPKTLHVQIHNFLRDNKISVDSNHWNVIRDMVNSCEEYTYVRR